jgi:hypothetical protein
LIEDRADPWAAVGGAYGRFSRAREVVASSIVAITIATSANLALGDDPAKPRLATRHEAPSTPLDTPGVKLLERRTTLDLRGWKETSPDEIVRHRKQSKAVSFSEFTIVRTHAGGKVFLHRMGTTSPIPPEIDCTNCRVEEIKKDISPAPREWNIVFDIQNEPIERPFSIRFSVTFWNAFQTADQWWGGFRILQPTKRATYKILFPLRQRPLAEQISFAFINAATGQRQLVMPAPHEARPLMGKDRRADEVEWTIDHPDDDRSYRIYWNQPELAQPRRL